jgi:hypothetical protein
MKTNEISCFYESDDVFVGAASHVSIAYIENLNTMSIALDIVVGDDRHTVYIPHSAVPQIIQAFNSSYYSIADAMQQMEAEHGK